MNEQVEHVIPLPAHLQPHLHPVKFSHLEKFGGLEALEEGAAFLGLGWACVQRIEYPVLEELLVADSNLRWCGGVLLWVGWGGGNTSNFYVRPGETRCHAYTHMTVTRAVHNTHFYTHHKHTTNINTTNTLQTHTTTTTTTHLDRVIGWASFLVPMVHQGHIQCTPGPPTSQVEGAGGPVQGNTSSSGVCVEGTIRQEGLHTCGWEGWGVGGRGGWCVEEGGVHLRVYAHSRVYIGYMYADHCSSFSP